MKSKFNILVASILSTMFVSEVFSQLKVVPSGRVGIGTNNPGAPLHVYGVQILTGANGHTLRLHPNNPTPEIGSSSGNIHFWYSGIGYNELRAKKYVKISDASLKTERSPIEYPMSKIMSLRAYRYMFLDSFPVNEAGDSISLIPEYGFISQEIQETLQDVNITQEGKDGLLLMEYDQIIPLLVAAMQEQQNQISALEASIATIMSRSQQIEEEENDTLNICQLFNASPNPFNNSTTISYNLACNVTTAEIKIWDIQGTEKKIFKLNPEEEQGQVVVQSTDLSVSG